MNNINPLKNNKVRSTKNISLTLSLRTYFDLKKYVPYGKLSSLTNSLFEEYLKNKKREELIASYKRIAKSKSRRENYKFTEGAITDGIK